MVKKKLSKIKSGEKVEVTADSLVVKENIERFLDEKKIKVDITEEGGIFKLIFNK